jgi:hypothetical protein
VARGSTLLNITQQISSSVGVAVISVVLTNQLKNEPLALPAIAAQQDPAIAERIGGPAGVQAGLVQAADSFATTYTLAWVLVLLTLVPVFFLPRKREVTHLLDDKHLPPAVVP